MPKLNLRYVGSVTLFDDVQAAIRDAMEETGTPGVAVGMLHEGEEHVAGFGVTSVENPLDVTPETLFQVGSITKTFTGTTAMRLVADGLLDLDAPLRTYLPDLRLSDEDVSARVTMRHLLTHTGGWIGDYFDDLGSGDDALAQMIDRLADLPQLTPLGEIWSYNNAGFYLAGRVIEVLSGKTYEQAVQELVLTPLGLANTFYFAEDVMTRRFAVGHHRAEEGPPTVARPWPIGRAHHAAGAITSNVRELLRWARFHLSDGEGVLTRASLDEMQRVQVEAASSLDPFGLTWFIIEREGARIIGHGGGTNGQIADFFFVPEHDFAFASLTNHQRGGEVNRAARAAVLQAIGMPDPVHTPIVVDADEYLGTYTSPLYDVELKSEDDVLTLVMTSKGGFPRRDSPPQPSPPPMTVAFFEQDRLFLPEERGSEVEFLRGEDGRIAWFRVGGRTLARAPD
jgi:CubicO group peptidase (beta-lactamase class C family)